jgi:hypothetical protein
MRLGQVLRMDLAKKLHYDLQSLGESHGPEFRKTRYDLSCFKVRRWSSVISTLTVQSMSWPLSDQVEGEFFLFHNAS